MLVYCSNYSSAAGYQNLTCGDSAKVQSLEDRLEKDPARVFEVTCGIFQPRLFFGKSYKAAADHLIWANQMFCRLACGRTGITSYLHE